MRFLDRRNVHRHANSDDVILTMRPEHAALQCVTDAMFSVLGSALEFAAAHQ
jgi:hypothetical protein